MPVTPLSLRLGNRSRPRAAIIKSSHKRCIWSTRGLVQAQHIRRANAGMESVGRKYRYTLTRIVLVGRRCEPPVEQHAGAGGQQDGPGHAAHLRALPLPQPRGALHLHQPQHEALPAHRQPEMTGHQPRAPGSSRLFCPTHAVFPLTRAHLNIRARCVCITGGCNTRARLRARPVRRACVRVFRWQSIR